MPKRCPELNKFAQDELGRMYQYVDGMQDYVRAMEWCTKKQLIRAMNKRP